MPRPLLVGEAPSKSGDRYWAFPLSGAVGQRLCELADIEPEAEGSRYGRYYWALREYFDCTNLLERYPGPQGRGASLPAIEARAAVGPLLAEYSNEVVVLLGARLPAHFDFEEAEFHRWSDDVRGRQMVTIPHPSGLNRMYNSTDECTRVTETLREAMRRAGV